MPPRAIRMWWHYPLNFCERKIRMRKAILFITFFLVISACAVKPESKAPEIIVQTKATILPSKTVFINSEEPKKEPSHPTVTHFITPSPSQTATIIPTAEFDFTKTRIFGTENRGSSFLVIFEIPGLDRNYRVSINGSDYQCEFEKDVADKLFCNGDKLRANEYVKVMLFDLNESQESTGKALYESELFVAEPYKTPLPLGDPATWCPQRGQNVYCETEHRVEDDEECWVSTCVDACGYYYSYHTCKLPPGGNFLTP